jgi:pimeloyl-ACP methyl ester carboxylesterase
MVEHISIEEDAVTLLLSVLITVTIVLSAWFLTIHHLAVYISKKFVFAQTKSMDYTLEKSIENGGFTQEEFDELELSGFVIDSDYGYELSGVYQRGSDPTKAVIFVHGHTWSWHGQVKYFYLYQRRGYSIITYNHRGHGDSGGENCSAGYFEKYDLDTVVRWTHGRFPEVKTLGLMGESLGGATVLQYVPLAKDISFIHADCPYSSMRKLYDYQLSLRNIPRFMRTRIIDASRSYILKKAGFDSFEVEPEQAIMKAEVPVLLIHGEADTYVPPWMSRQMYESRKHYASTYCTVIPDAVHAQSLQTDRKRYEEAVDEFLDNVEQA